jgi:hypothetical protein
MDWGDDPTSRREGQAPSLENDALLGDMLGELIRDNPGRIGSFAAKW